MTARATMARLSMRPWLISACSCANAGLGCRPSDSLRLGRWLLSGTRTVTGSPSNRTDDSCPLSDLTLVIDLTDFSHTTVLATLESLPCVTARRGTMLRGAAHATWDRSEVTPVGP
jgi:hypothetical protein